MMDRPHTSSHSSVERDERRHPCRYLLPRGFSLVELLVAMAVLALMSVLMLSITSAAQRLAKQTTSRVEEFREARRAFERVNQTLSLATLNPYFDYVNSSGQPRTTNNASTFVPSKYFRLSELRYLQTNASSLTAPHGGTNAGLAVFFQAPLGKSNTNTLTGLNSLLNTIGYYVEQSSDSTLRPSTVSSSKTRYRLFELIEPSESLTIYSLTSGNATTNTTVWFTTPLTNAAYSHSLANNIVALVFQAQYTDTNSSPISTNNYTSTPLGNATQSIQENNLPPNVRVSMVAVDEPSARRIVDMNLTLTNAIDDTSLSALETQLGSKHLNYRRFQSTVSIGPAKWSSK